MGVVRYFGRKRAPRWTLLDDLGSAKGRLMSKSSVVLYYPRLVVIELNLRHLLICGMCLLGYCALGGYVPPQKNASCVPRYAKEGTKPEASKSQWKKPRSLRAFGLVPGMAPGPPRSALGDCRTFGAWRAARHWQHGARFEIGPASPPEREGDHKAPAPM